KERQAVNFSMSGQPRGLVLSIWLAASCAAVPPALVLTSSPRYALSESKREELPAPAEPPANGETAPSENSVPMPDLPGTTPPAASQPKSPAEPEQSDTECESEDRR